MKRELIEFSEEFGIDRIVCCYSDRGVEQLANLLTYRAELAHYQQVRPVRGEAYTLERYMQDLQPDEPLAAALRAGFEDGVRRLDFRAAWIQEGYDFPEDLPDE